MKLPTKILIGPVLDWAVAKSINEDIQEFELNDISPIYTTDGYPYQPSSNWSQGGPLLEDHAVMLFCGEDCQWYAFNNCNEYNPFYVNNFVNCTLSDASAYGDTPLIAVCRAIVISHFGDNVDIPDELIPYISDFISNTLKNINE
ncbi:DUF2591 domain-containing protein [Xenorhabdus bovienii]|uniref:phage protein NinX family protein n=1 Tax=Xenorhabdus bovienii TaxID=40576 RepID=UPI0023B2B5EA|nr:phage protein NinX family protein [Xenorhabdus bovienii]MDE9517862.1 DUF2591 domain-containing protein [Xenorhabdus bovienii]